MSITTDSTMDSNRYRAVGGGLPGVIESEWIKLWSVRSTWWSLTVGFVLIMGYAFIKGIAVRYGNEHLSATEITIEGAFYLAQFTAVALATMFITSEYASASIRSSLQWTPVRHRWLLGKSIALMPVLFAFGVVLAGAGIGASMVIMNGNGPATTLSSALWTVVAMGAYFALIGLLSLGVATALRSTAGGIVTMFLLLLVLPPLTASILGDLANYLPGVSGTIAMAGLGQEHTIFGTAPTYSPWVGIPICAIWAGVGLFTGAVVLRKRDV